MVPIFFKELVFNGQPANALMSHALFKFQAFDFFCLFLVALENLGTSLQKLAFPLANLVGMDLELLGKL